MPGAKCPGAREINLVEGSMFRDVYILPRIVQTTEWFRLRYRSGR